MGECAHERAKSSLGKGNCGVNCISVALFYSEVMRIQGRFGVFLRNESENPIRKRSLCVIFSGVEAVIRGAEDVFLKKFRGECMFKGMDSDRKQASYN